MPDTMHAGEFEVGPWPVARGSPRLPTRSEDEPPRRHRDPRRRTGRARTRAVPAAVVVGALVLSGCGGDDGEETGSAGPTPAPTTPAPTTAAPTTPAPTTPPTPPSEPTTDTQTTAATPPESTAVAASDQSVEVVVVEAANERVTDVTVYTPVGDGSWPTVVLYPGWDQPRSTLDPFARQLAAEGFAVATTDYDGSRLISGDYECAQQFATLAAWDHGGDPDGVTVTGGHFFGASVASMASLFEPFIQLGSSEPIDCGLEGQDGLRPTDLVVGLSGEWYPNECDLPPEAGPLSGGLPPYVLPYDGNPGVPFVVAHGTDNPYCAAEQAAAAAVAFEEGGHPTEFLELDGAGFAQGIIFVASDDEWPEVTADPDSESSRAVVDAIVEAVSALGG